jgi:hypothetical protein
MKPFRLNLKEIRRAFEDGTTIVVRQQASGLYMVAAVDLATRLPVFKPSYVERDQVPAAVAAEVRMLDRCGWGGRGARASRERNLCTPHIVSAPSTEAEIAASDNKVIRDSHKL